MRNGSPSAEAVDVRPPSGTVPSHAPLDGTLARSLERTTRLAAAALRAPTALVALLGTDRRCFMAGSGLPAWFAHDTGVLVRSGLCGRIIAEGGALALHDARADEEPEVAGASAELGIAGFAGVPLTAADGSNAGVFCVIDSAPRDWSAEELDILLDLAATATTELELRRTLAEREAVERQLRHNALHDALTGLPNRAFFMERLSHATQRALRWGEHLFAVLFLDLDNFKIVNDSVGHHAGDELLVAVARRLEACVRSPDMVARLGGDEFAILLESVHEAEDAARVAERVQEALVAPVSVGGYEVFTSTSIGIALSPSAGERPEFVLRSADMAMYRAKRAGRARYALFDHAMHKEALARLQLETDLRKALERDEFELHYQPIVSLATGKIVGVEALLRWRHAERGLVGPADFVPVAEETGLLLPLTRWVLSAACRQVGAWRETRAGGAPLSVAVNLSVRQFSQPELVEQIAAVLAETEIEPSALRLDITERVLIERPEVAAQALATLAALGVRVQMDDFGTGVSSLGHLHRLPLDGIKIDPAFISRMDADGRALQLTRTIVGMVRDLGLATTAEGVSTEEQLRRLRALGCTYAQGYLFSAPVEAPAIETLLRGDPTW
jgi:diguanylate cyclase (GGDEF)-like protein